MVGADRRCSPRRRTTPLHASLALDLNLEAQRPDGSLTVVSGVAATPPFTWADLLRNTDLHALLLGRCTKPPRKAENA